MSHNGPENLKSLQVLLQQNPDSLTFARVADALRRNGRLEEAIQVCEEGVRRHPNYVTGHMVLGKCYLEKKLYDQAEKEFKRVLLYDPKYIAAHRHYGDLMKEIGWDNTYEMSYRKIFKIDPLDDNVRTIVETLDREAQEKEESVVPTGSFEPLPEIQEKIPLTTVPITDEDLLEVTSKKEQKPKPPPPAIEPEPAIEKQSEPIQPSEPEPAPIEHSESDPSNFSSVLHDIFPDEIISNSSSTRNSEKNASEPSQDESAQQNDDLAFDIFQDAEQPEQAIPTRPIDFENDLDHNIPLSESDQASQVEHSANDEFSKSTPDEADAAPDRREPPRQSTTQIMQTLESSGSRDKIVTPTLGEIYAAQGQYAKAIGVFELLSKKNPNNDQFREKINYLKKRLQETQNAGSS